MAGFGVKAGAALTALLMVSGGVTAPAAAQQTLNVKPGKSWRHGHSGITLPATLAGIASSGAKSYANDQLDVSMSYEPEGTSDFLSVFIYRNTNGGVPVWFAQAQWAIEHRDIFGKASPVTPQAFVPPRQTNASGLKAVYAFDGSRGIKSTGIALLPVGDWYVKLRLTSKGKNAQEVSAILDRALAEISWPSKMVSGPAATPVAPCATPLVFNGVAKDAPKDGANNLLGGLLGMMAADPKIKKQDATPQNTPPTLWCRERQLDDNQALYRAAAETDQYLVALGDNGNAVWVRPDNAAALLADAKKGPASAPSYAISMMLPDKIINFVPQDRLPSFERVVELINGNRVTVTVPTWGKSKTITVSPDAV